jgi:hypothetical protein
MRAINVKCRTADELLRLRLDDGECADVLAYFGIGTMEKSSVVRMTIYQAIDGIGIWQSSSARSHR